MNYRARKIRNFFRRVLKASAAIALIIIAATFGLWFSATNLKITDPKILLATLLGMNGPKAEESKVEQSLHAATGFTIDLYSDKVRNARFMAVTKRGDLLVSAPRDGQVYLLEADRNGDGKSDKTRIVIEDLRHPQGLDIIDGWLYIALSNGFGRLPFDVDAGTATGSFEILVDDLPDTGRHRLKVLRISPQRQVYINVGSSCDVCKEDDERSASILKYELNGSGVKLVASGVRNSEGFDWAPWDGALYATDMGRDWLGDDFPPCEFNKIIEGGFYGWPYINGFGVLDPDLGDGREDLLTDAISPVFGFKAHSSPLGMRFLRSKQLPADYQSAALVALHGSWNRSTPEGYKVVALHRQADGGFVESDFLTGFEVDGNIIGRPVDVIEGPDGAIYVSDDYAGAIYRVRYGGSADD